MFKRNLAAVGALLLGAATLAFIPNEAFAQKGGGKGGGGGGGGGKGGGGGGGAGWYGGAGRGSSGWGNGWGGYGWGNGWNGGWNYGRNWYGYGWYYPRFYGWYGNRGYYPDYGWYGSYPDYSWYGDQYGYGNQYGTTSDMNVARLRIIAPTDAQVWIEGQPTDQSGSMRFFESPPLDPGSSYTYEVRARWHQDGKDVDQVRRVPVHAGDMVTVNFMQPEQR